ncbi:MAG: prolyl oligopeptidase family serine peptidase [Myxococcota bacterium]
MSTPTPLPAQHLVPTRQPRSPSRSTRRPTPARRDPVVDRLHGVDVPDPYRWLEQPDGAGVAAWIDGQDAATTAFLGALPTRERFRERLRALFGYARLGVPVRTAGGYLWTRNDGLAPHAVLVASDTADPTAGRVVLDPNTWSTDGSVGLASWRVSPDGRWLAYATTDGGTDWHTIRVRDLRTGVDLPDVVRWVKFSVPSFLPDSSGFLYARFPAPPLGAGSPDSAEAGRSGSHPEGGAAENRDHRVMVHRLGTAQADDVVVFARPDHPDQVVGAQVFVDPTDGSALIVAMADSGASGRTGVFVADRVEGPFRELCPVEAVHEVVAVIGRRVVIRTDAPFGRADGIGAARFRLIAVDADDPRRWDERVPETADALVAAHRVGDRLFALYLHHARTRVAVHALDGAPLGDLPLPGLGTVDGFDGEPDHDEAFFRFTSFTSPSTVYRVALPTAGVAPWYAPSVPFDTARLHTEQVFVDRPDGTRVPAFVSYAGELVRDGSRPTLLYGYGGFAIPLTPAFETSLIPWLEAGGVYVVANLRGGGEYGRAWHLSGTGDRKQDVFDDFVAVAEHLIATGVTSRPKLAIHGHSNGGLLVGAVLVQRPELFGAAVPAVGVLDMLRYHKFTIGWSWTEEFGSADDAAPFEVLLRYSPVHNCRSADYPPTLILTADHDDRVVPAHSYKFAAALQHAQRGEAPILLRIERRAGHGASKPLTKLIDERADLWAFLAWALGLSLDGAATQRSA